MSTTLNSTTLNAIIAAAKPTKGSGFTSRVAKPAITISSAEIGRDAEGAPVPVIVASNSSAAHGYLSRGRLEVVQRDAGGKEVFREELSGPDIQQSLGYGLIGGGQSRRIVLPEPLPAAEGTVTAKFTPDS